MNAISRKAHADEGADARHAAIPTLGLGPNQLSWLRRNIDAFKDAEDQRLQVRQDAMRAARAAGLVSLVS